MVGIGIIGMGFMGVTHFKAAQKLRGGKIVAICTRDPKKLAGDWRAVKGNFGGGGGVHDLGAIAAYPDLHDLIHDPKVDLVDVCLPTEMHKAVTLAALRAGKHVLVEKSIAPTLAQADVMLAAAKKSRRQLMVAHVLRFFPEYRYLREAVASKQFGRLRALHLKRITASPHWMKRKRRVLDISVDLHIHDTDFLCQLFGPPRRVSSRGLRDFTTGEGIYVTTHYDFGRPELAVSACAGAVSTPGIPFEQGYDAYFEEASVAFNSTHCSRVTVTDPRGRKSQPRLRYPDAFMAQLQEAVSAVSSGRPSSIIGAESARDSLAACLAEWRSATTGRPVAP